MIGHHAALFAAYAAALAGWAALAARVPSLWSPVAPPTFRAPWREVAWALVATAAVVTVGMTYSRGWLLPATSTHRPALDVLNQLLIFSPYLLLLLIRRQRPDTAWLRTNGVPYRVAAGLALALVALLIYALVRTGIRSWPALALSVYQPSHVSNCAQVLLEDIGIAILFVRIRAAMGLRWTLVLVAAFFAAAHVPALLAAGAGPAELLPLLGDLCLGVAVLSVVQRSQDVWWFWMVHFALDMTQFFPGATAV